MPMIMNCLFSFLYRIIAKTMVCLAHPFFVVKLVAIVVLCLFTARSSFGQNSIEPFGKNRIQYRTFDWQFISSPNFEVYYYDGRRAIATEAIKFLESEYDRISELIGYTQTIKTKVFLFNSLNHLRQSNLGIDAEQLTEGGGTSFVKPYVGVAYPGTLDEFKEELIFEVSKSIINEMMFGGSLKDIVRNATLLKLPSWVIDGAALYIAKGWDSEMDDFARQFTQNKSAQSALKTSGMDATMIGQSIWNYIVVIYGKAIMGNILNYIRVIRNEQRAFSTTLGIRFQYFINDWKKFYLSESEKIATSYTAPDPTTRLAVPSRKNTLFTAVKISPDGNKVAFASNHGGKYKVAVKSFENGKETVILNGGTRVYKEIVDYRVPLLSWADSTTLAVIGVNNNRYVMWLYNLRTKSKSHLVLNKFNNIRSFDISSSGRLAVLSADINGQNDIFLSSTNRTRIRQLTNDIFDDFDPKFIPETNSFIFSSNRTTDTTNIVKEDIIKTTKNFSLFSFNLDTTTNIVNRLTNSYGKDYQPLPVSKSKIFYLSDQRGVVNLFKYYVDNGVQNQVTNFPYGIRNYDINLSTSTLALVTISDLRQGIYVIKNFDFERQVFTPASNRKEYQQFREISSRKTKKEVKEATSIKKLIDQKLKESRDTTKLTSPPKDQKTKTDPIVKSDSIIDTEDYTFSDEKPKVEEAKSSLDSTKSNIDTNNLDVSDYKFSDEATSVLAKKTEEQDLSKFIKTKEKIDISVPRKYFSEFSYDNLGTDFVVDPLRGFSLRLNTQMNDILGDYRLRFGFQTAFDFKNGDVFAEFEYLKHRVDYSLRFDRKALFLSQNNHLRKYTFQKLEVGLSLPINVRTRISFKPFLGYTHYLDLGQVRGGSPGPPVFESSMQQIYGGAKAEIVYDNSIVTNLNAIEGTRGKIGVVSYYGIGNEKANFSQFYFDIRHYQKIYKEIVLAVRAYGGTYFGNSPKKYVLGGMDNWIGNTINYGGLHNPLFVNSGYNQNVIFTEFVTSLRGFDYATIYGSSVALANVELRLPLIRTLASGPIASNFFRNIQFTLFYDVGSSWTGPPPINAQSNLNSEEINQGPFEIKIKQYLNPWLYSYGLGFRTMILGYYLKLDFAWPVENFKVKSPRLMLTLGFDF